MITSVLASVAVALAMPAGGGDAGTLCHSATFSNPRCCKTDLAGVATSDCVARKFFASTLNRERSLMHFTLLTASPVPSTIAKFKSTCAADGKAAKCCILPLVRKFYLILVDALLKRDGT